MTRPTLPAINRFNKLVEDISVLYMDARESQVRFALETGRLISEVQKNEAIESEYGDHFIDKLSEVLTSRFGAGFSASNLRRMLRFYFEQKKAPALKLSWSNHIELMRVKDLKKRKDLANQAAKGGLTKYELRQLVHKHQPQTRLVKTVKPSKPLPPLKPPTDLKLNTYAKFNEQEIDCGFYISWPATKADLDGVTITDKPSYTYTARVERVIDGDTLCVGINAGFRINLHDKLRLRGIDCPELKTPEGKAAKRYVEKLLPAGTLIVIKSRKITVDTHGRFVMDLFYLEPDSSAEEIITSGNYLNQHLIDAGYAVRMAE